MSSKTFKLLAAIAAILSIYSFFVAGDQPVAQFDFVSGRKLIPSIDTDRLSSIEIEGWGKKTVLTRQGENYVVSNRNNYPAAAKSYSELVRSVLKASCDEEITADRSRVHRRRSIDSSRFGPSRSVSCSCGNTISYIVRSQSRVGNEHANVTY